MGFDGFSSAYELAITENGRLEGNENNVPVDDKIELPETPKLPKLPPNNLLKHAVSAPQRKSNNVQLVETGITDTHIKELKDLISSHILTQDRVLIISSGTKSKLKKFKPEMNIKTYEEFATFQPPSHLLSDAIPASTLYQGPNHKLLIDVIEDLQQEFDIEHQMISPLYGLISPFKRIIPYECSYLDKSYYLQVKMATDKNIPFQLQQMILNSNVDVIILALSRSYQVIIDLLSKQAIRHKTVYLLKYRSGKIELQHVLLQ